MPDFSLPPELALLQESVRAFATERLRPRDRAHEAARGIAPEIAALHRELGIGALELPEALGGAGLGALARVLVTEELAAADAGAALALDALGPALYALRELGGEEALRRHALPLLVRPGARAVLALDAAPRLRTGGGLVRGALPYVPADRVDLLVVLERERAYVTAGPFALTPLRGAGLRAAGASELTIAGEAKVQEEWVGTPGARRALARTRLLVAAALVGVARASSEYARAYALERVAFGRPIAHHQALAFLLVDMALAVDAARLLVWQAAAGLDGDENGSESADALCASAFVEAAEAALFVTPNGVQVLGGHGFVQDHPVEKWMREARTLALLAGGTDLAREDAGRRLAQGGATPLALESPAWS